MTNSQCGTAGVPATSAVGASMADRGRLAVEHAISWTGDVLSVAMQGLPEEASVRTIPAQGAFITLLVLTIAVFTPSVAAPFHLDDFALFSDQIITSPWGWWHVWRPLQTRPLTWFTFWVNYWLGGEVGRVAGDFKSPVRIDSRLPVKVKRARHSAGHAGLSTPIAALHRCGSQEPAYRAP